MSGEQLLYNRPLPGVRLNMAHPLSKGLVVCLLLNEQAGLRAMDLSPYANHGLLVGFPAGSQRAFNGLSFDGTNGFIDLGDFLVINSVLSALTIEMWFKCLGTNKTGGNWHLMLVKAGAGLWATWYLDEAGTTLSVRANIGVGTNTASTSVSVDTWHHAAQVFDGSTNKLFVNGVLAQSVAAIGTLDDPTGSPLEIGRAGVEYFWGLIGEVCIYNRALSAEDIKALYLSPYKPMGIPLFL